jgi:hypothetical protein
MYVLVGMFSLCGLWNYELKMAETDLETEIHDTECQPLNHSDLGCTP